jgi:GTP-binding protein
MPLKLAIVGRPNVGKSTLFNRLAGAKLAIVDPTPGVTRDRRHAPGRLADLELELIDTAGYEDVVGASLEARMRAQTEAAIEEAETILFLIDARAGVTPADEHFADLLRRADKPVVLAANKCEGAAGDAGLYEAFALGLGEPVAISGEEGDGMSDLYQALRAAAPDPEADVTEMAAGDDDAIAPEKPIKLAIVGRPNAGKSTLTNALLGQERMLTGPEAGITREAVSVPFEWNDQRFDLIDTAGIRRKAKVEGKLEQLSVADTIRSIRFGQVCALVMDESEAFEKQDLTIADLITREGRALVFVLAKWDKVEDNGARFKELRERAEDALPQMKYAPVVRVSALGGRGLDGLMKAVIEAHRDWSARVKTGDLNRWLAHAVAKHPPPAVHGRAIKPRYISQTKSRPPTFVLMSSRGEDMPEHYKRYLVNGIREAFKLGGAPIRLIVRSGKNPFAEGEER